MGSGTADVPDVIRFQDGTCYDVSSNQEIDLDSATGERIRAAAESYGEQHDQAWDQLTGEFKFNAKDSTLMPTSTSL